MKLAWTTDIHLDFLRTSDMLDFAESIKETDADALIISGDIAQSFCLNKKLTELYILIKKKIYFVLGNHDYYKSSIDKVNKEVRHIIDGKYNDIHWLTNKIYPLTDSVCITGDEGWYDARLGNLDIAGSINDFNLIKDFQFMSKYEIAETAQEMVKKAAYKAEKVLIDAAKKYKTVIFTTHFPPFPELSKHLGKRSEPEFMPWYSNMTFGYMLSDVALQFPQTKFIVLCGHSHCESYYKHFDNLEGFCGDAVYKYPKINKVFTINTDISW
jgi:Icc-related predicted phosphoesterase